MATHISRGRLWRGAVAGLIASIAMGVYAMAASLANGTGFFTPLYHIASAIGSPKAMKTSMPAAMDADGVIFLAGPAALGADIHLVVGALAGVVFALLTGPARLGGIVLVVAGVGFGLLVMAVDSLLLLPVTARLFGGGEPISDMGGTAGWATFAVEHVIHGLVLGVVLAALAHTLGTSRSEAAGGRPGGAADWSRPAHTG